MHNIAVEVNHHSAWSAVVSLIFRHTAAQKMEWWKAAQTRSERKQDWKVFQPHRLHNKWPWPLWPLCSKSETRQQDYKTTRQQQLRQKNMGLWCCAADTQPKNYILKNGWIVKYRTVQVMPFTCVQTTLLYTVSQFLTCFNCSGSTAYNGYTALTLQFDLFAVFFWCIN